MEFWWAGFLVEIVGCQNSSPPLSTTARDTPPPLRRLADAYVRPTCEIERD